MLRKDIFLECSTCGYRKDVKDFRLDCPNCGYPSALFQIKYSQAPKEFPLKEYAQSILRYLPFLPLEAEEVIDPIVGNTPLLYAKNIGKSLGLKNLYIKDETRNPSGSFKDRGAVIGISVANVLGYNIINVASSGNFASAIARACAIAGHKCIALVPEDTPEEKIVMIAAYGGKVIKIKGIFDDCRKLSIELSKRKNIISASWDLKPFTLEGWKTTVFEIFEQMGQTLPDVILIPAGGGGHILGAWKAIKELLILKKIKKIPKIVGVQASGSAPYVEAFRKGLDDVPKIENPQTIAKSLKVLNPLEKKDVLKAMREINGIFIDVSDKEILDALNMLGKMEGIFAEASSAASLAGLKKLIENGEIDLKQKIVIIVTGSGLKDVADIKDVFKSSLFILKDAILEDVSSIL